MALPPPPGLPTAPSPGFDRASAGEEVWSQLSRQFVWVCVAQAGITGVCGASLLPQTRCLAHAPLQRCCTRPSACCLRAALAGTCCCPSRAGSGVAALGSVSRSPAKSLCPASATSSSGAACAGCWSIMWGRRRVRQGWLLASFALTLVTLPGPPSLRHAPPAQSAPG